MFGLLYKNYENDYVNNYENPPQQCIMISFIIPSIIFIDKHYGKYTISITSWVSSYFYHGMIIKYEGNYEIYYEINY